MQQRSRGRTKPLSSLSAAAAAAAAAPSFVRCRRGGNEKEEEEEEGDSLSPSSTLKLGPEAASAASLFCSGGVA